MSDSIESLLSQAQAQIGSVADLRALEQLRVDWLGKKGRVTDLLKSLGTMAPDQRKVYGEQVNRAKDQIGAWLDSRKAALSDAELSAKLAGERIDVTLPGRGETTGDTRYRPHQHSVRSARIRDRGRAGDRGRFP